jgi:hypothetical protein
VASALLDRRGHVALVDRLNGIKPHHGFHWEQRTPAFAVEGGALVVRVPMAGAAPRRELSATEAFLARHARVRSLVLGKGPAAPAAAAAAGVGASASAGELLRPARASADDDGERRPQRAGAHRASGGPLSPRASPRPSPRPGGLPGEGAPRLGARAAAGAISRPRAISEPRLPPIDAAADRAAQRRARDRRRADAERLRDGGVFESLPSLRAEARVDGASPTIVIAPSTVPLVLRAREGSPRHQPR